MDDADLGTLEQHGDDWTLTFTRDLAHPVEKVWRAVTEPEHLEAWFPDTILGEIAPGARLRFVMSKGSDEGFDGEVLVYEPPAVLEIAWGTDRIRITLEPHGGGTRLTFVDTFAELGKAARDGAGWHECIENLVRHLSGEAPAEAGAAWRAVHPLYVERLGPDASTIGPPEGWDES